MINRSPGRSAFLDFRLRLGAAYASEKTTPTFRQSSSHTARGHGRRICRCWMAYFTSQPAPAEPTRSIWMQESEIGFA